MKKFSLPLVIAFTLSAAAVVSAGADKNSDKAKKATLKVKASPAIAFSPARVILTGDLSGADNEALYCAAVEWQWGDGTKSDQKADCDPYVAGQSEVKRHFVVDRVFDTSGDYHVTLTLKQKDKIVAYGSTLVKIRPGLRDGGGGQ